MTKSRPAERLQRFISSYGMIFVLLMLMLLFTVLTWKEQTPVGRDAGWQVADIILADRAQAVVIVAAGASNAEEAFAQAVEERLTTAGAMVVQSVSGQPADARRAIADALENNITLTHVAISGIASRWTVFDRFDANRIGRRVAPQTYHWPVFAQT